MSSAKRGKSEKLPFRLNEAAFRGAVGLISLGLCEFAAAAAAEAPAASPEAAEGGGMQLEEVVVTAQKREESLQKVPLSVVALGADELSRRNITSLADLMGGQVPALRIEPFAGNPTVLEVGIRGFIDSNGVNVTNENPVPIYIDDVYQGRQTATSLQLMEIERVEVLRGPQGTLFGRNAEGGAVRFVSKEPTGVFGIREHVEGGNFGYWNTTTHLDLPQVANVSTKIDFLDRGDHGQQDNPAPGQRNFGTLRATAARFTALWKPVDTFSLEYSYDWTQLKSVEYFNQQLSSNDLYQFLAPTFTTPIWPIQSDRASNTTYPLFRPYDNQKFTGHRATAAWNISDSVTLKSITAYRSDQSPLWNTASTSAAVPGAFLGSSLGYLSGVSVLYDIRHNQFSQEFQLIGNTPTLNWVTGLFYFNEHGSQIDTTYFGLGFPNAITSGPPGFVPVALGAGTALDPPFQVPGSATGAVVHNRSYAAFGQVTWRPDVWDSKLSYTAGLRVGKDEKDATRPTGGVYTNVSYPIPPATITPPPDYDCTVVPRPAQCSSNTSQTKVLPLASVGYDWTKSVTSYLRYSTGYQAAVVGLAGQTFQAVKPSTVDSFELGTKTELFNHRARLNLAVFYLNWKNPQENVQTVSSSTVEYYNGPTIKISGLEFDSSFIITDGLQVSVNANYLNGSQPASLNPFPNPYLGGAAPPVFNKLFDLPKWTGSVSVLYDIMKTNYGTWRLDADANATAAYYTVPQVQQAVRPYTLINGQFGLAEIPVGAGKLDVFAWGKNLANKSYEVFIYNVPASFALDPTKPATSTDAAFGAARTYGLSLNYTF
jgi:iron complex outermembrane receptor protein